MNIVAIGEKNFVDGFQLAGVRRIETTRTDFEKKFRETFESKQIGIIVADDKNVAGLPAVVRKKLESSVLPVVVTISEKGGGTELSSLIKRCIGIDLWK